MQVPESLFQRSQMRGMRTVGKPPPGHVIVGPQGRHDRTERGGKARRVAFPLAGASNLLELAPRFLHAASGGVEFVLGGLQGGLDSRPALDQRSQGRRDGRTQQQPARLRLVLAFDPFEDAGDDEVDLPRLQPTLRNVLGRRDVSGPEIGEAAEPFGQGESGRIDDDRRQITFQPRHFILGGLCPRLEGDLILLHPGQLLRPVARNLRKIGERQETLPDLSQRSKARKGDQQSLDLAAPGIDPGAFSQDVVVQAEGLVPRRDQLGILRGEGIDLLSFRPQRRQPDLEIGQLSAPGAVLVEPVGFAADLLEVAAQIGQAGAGRKQQLPEIALAREDALAALFQRVVVEREHRPVGVAIDVAQLRLDERLRDRLVAGVEEAVLGSLHPDQFPGAARKFERCADAHRRIGMKEVEARPRLDPEQKIQESRQSRRLTGLVRTVDDVEIGRALLRRAEIDAAPGEPAIAREVEPS